MPAITSETSVELPPATATTATLLSTAATPLAIINASSFAAPYADSSSTLHPLERRLQLDTASGGGVASWLPALPSIAPIVLSNLLPALNGTRPAAHTTSTSTSTDSDSTFPTFRPPSIANLVASSAEDLSNFRDVSFDIFDEDDDLFGSPLAFDASENGLWNGRFVPPPPRPPFFVDEPVLSDGLTTCDLCSWAMPTKSTFIFEGTIEKASELGWPLTLIIVSILSALLGAIVMVTVVRCRRKKASNNRNETHVQWWSRNKRSNGSNNNNHLRRSNIYTAHPADSIRGLQQPSLSAASSLTTMTAMGGATGPQLPAMAAPGTSQQLQQQQQQYYLSYHQHQLPQHHNHAHHHHEHEPAYEHEYHQPQELQLQLQHQRQSSSSISSVASSPTLPAAKSLKPIAMQLQHQPLQHQHPHMVDGRQQLRDEASGCHWPNATIVVAS